MRNAKPNENGYQQPCFLGFGTIKECPNMCNKGKCGYAPQDKVWEEFLDVLTGKRSSVTCPTLEELAGAWIDNQGRMGGVDEGGEQFTINRPPAMFAEWVEKFPSFFWGYECPSTRQPCRRQCKTTCSRW